MNPSTLIGIVASIGLLAVVLLFAAKEPALFIDLPSLGIVLVGTLAATFISYPLREVTGYSVCSDRAAQRATVHPSGSRRAGADFAAVDQRRSARGGKRLSSRSAILSCVPACSW